MRSLQRRFAVLVFASVLVFLVYLLLTNSGRVPSARSIQEQHYSFVPPIRDAMLHDNGDKMEHVPNQLLQVITENLKRTAQTQGSSEKAPSNDESPLKNQIKNPHLLDAPVDLREEPSEEKKQLVKVRVKDGPADGELSPGEIHQQPDAHQPVTLPPLSTDLSNPYSGPRNPQQQEIVGAFLHAWNHYKKYAWGHDELKPLSKGWQEWFGVGLTIVDSLDTMYIMGLHNEFAESRDWVANKLTFERDSEVQLFEIVIRALGGLLSAYHLSGDKIFLDKALDLGTRLYPCFSGSTKVPCSRINLRRGRPHFIEISTAEIGTIQLEFRDLARSVDDSRYEILLGQKLHPCLLGLTPIPCIRINLHRGRASFTDVSIAEIGTIQLEFRDLARSSQNATYETKIDEVSQHLHKLDKLDGLVACFINPHTGEFRPTSTVSVGASADSYYEYLIKQWIQTGKTKDWMKNDYLESVAGIEKHLYKHTARDHLGFVGAYFNMNSRNFRRDMEHLACFLPGTLALGYMAGLKFENHLKMAENLTKTCYEMYARMPTGLSPEVASMNMNNDQTDDFFVMTSSAFNLQRPETIESIFYMYRLTKDPKYREWGWNIFKAFEKYTKLQDGGYASISNVKNAEDPGYRDKMETFYLAETLKYLYLLFSDDPDLIPLDKYVINTEAHPLPVYTS